MLARPVALCRRARLRRWCSCPYTVPHLSYILRLTTVRKWITDGRVGREEQRDASGGLTTRCASVAFAAR